MNLALAHADRWRDSRIEVVLKVRVTMNRNTILVAAALLVPGAAHAEFQTKQ